MALEQKLSLKLAQKLVMTPSLQQAIKLLQMTRMELQTVLAEELEQNPVLEETVETLPDENKRDEDDQPQRDDELDHKESMEQVDLESYFSDYWESSGYASVSEHHEAPPLENTLTEEPDLYDHLLWQLSMLDIDERQREIAELIIGNLNHDGFLEVTPEEIRALGPHSPEAAAAVAELVAELQADADLTEAAMLANGDLAAALGGTLELSAAPPRESADAAGDTSAVDAEVQKEKASRAAADALTGISAIALELAPEGEPYTLEEIDAVLAILRTFDPPGIACRDMCHSLEVQIDRLQREEEEWEGYLDSAQQQRYDLARAIVCEHWDLFLKRQFPVLAKQLAQPLAKLEPAVDLIKSLDPRPGRRYSSDRPQYIEPDVAVVKVGDEYVIQLNDDGMPRLRVSRAYRRMLQRMKSDGHHTDAQAFIKDKMRSAVWLIKSLDQRQRTIYKVATSIVRQQQEFLERGIDGLRPMVLRDVAEDIGMHESTVSRVVSNKYIHTPRGLYPMKFFFHSGIDRDRGENISSLSVKRKIEQLIRDENPKRPLSDSALMRTLQREGIQIARRTVAKYRDELGISSSTDRKQVF